VLQADTMRDEILRLTDGARPDHRGWPLTVGGVAANWAAATRAFFADLAVVIGGISYPLVNDAALAAAETAMREYIETNGLGQSNMPAAFQVFAVVLAPLTTPPSVLPGGGPPPAPFLLPLLAPTADHIAPATAVAEAVLLWALTGLVEVGGVPHPWS
jgi:hypothetical protein